MQPTTELKEVVLCQVSENITTHPTLCAVESCALRSTEAAILSDHHLLDWDEYSEVAL